MKNVEFRYPQRSESAVKNINLRILTGEKIAIVGENGSGKTTLLYLLLGIYRPISGEASVNGKTMELNLDNYRKKTACHVSPPFCNKISRHVGAGWNIKEPRHARTKGKRVKCVSLCRVPGSGAAQGPCTLAVPLLGNTAPLPKTAGCAA